MEEYKKRITKMLQTITFVIYAVAMVAFFVCMFGVIKAGGGDLSLAFAFLFAFLGVMSFVVYSPRIISFVGDLIIKLLDKKKKKGKFDELFYCLLFSLAPLLLFGLIIGIMALAFFVF